MGDLGDLGDLGDGLADGFALRWGADGVGDGAGSFSSIAAAIESTCISINWSIDIEGTTAGDGLTLSLTASAGVGSFLAFDFFDFFFLPDEA